MAVKSLFSRMTFLDWFIVLSLLVGVGFSFFFVGQKKEGSLVIVEQNGKVIFSAPLEGDHREEVFTGPAGETLVVIYNREVFIGRSDCPRKICMGMGHIHRSGDVIACVPNQILVRIAGEGKGDEREYDILSR